MSVLGVGHCEICGAVVDVQAESNYSEEDYAAMHKSWHERLRAALAGVVSGERTANL